MLGTELASIDFIYIKVLNSAENLSWWTECMRIAQLSDIELTDSVTGVCQGKSWIFLPLNPLYDPFHPRQALALHPTPHPRGQSSLAVAFNQAFWPDTRWANRELCWRPYEKEILKTTEWQVASLVVADESFLLYPILHRSPHTCKNLAIWRPACCQLCLTSTHFTIHPVKSLRPPSYSYPKAQSSALDQHSPVDLEKHIPASP